MPFYKLRKYPRRVQPNTENRNIRVLGASSVQHALESLDRITCTLSFTQATGISGLSFNPAAKNPHKLIQNPIGRGACRDNKLIIWHDAINNSVSKHRSNNNNPLSPQQLCDILVEYSDCLLAIVYARRRGTPNLLSDLLAVAKRTGIFVIEAKKLLSPRKQRDPTYQQELSQLHWHEPLELQLIRTALSHAHNLKKQVDTHRRPKSKNKNKRTPRAKKALTEA